MAQAALRRVYALLLAIAFAGGVALPDADALLYHSGPATAGIPHFDQPGGCGSHAEHCVLACAASLRLLASGLARLPESAAQAAPDLSAAPATAPRTTDRTNLQPSRAPPTAS